MLYNIKYLRYVSHDSLVSDTTLFVVKLEVAVILVFVDKDYSSFKLSIISSQMPSCFLNIWLNHNTLFSKRHKFFLLQYTSYRENIFIDNLNWAFLLKSFTFKN